MSLSVAAALAAALLAQEPQAGSQISYDDPPAQQPAPKPTAPGGTGAAAAEPTAQTPEPTPEEPGSGEPSAPETLGESVHGTRFRAAAELSALALPSGTPDGGQDGFLAATPILGFDAGEEFAFEIGATLRLRVIDSAPSQRDTDYGVLRGEDWDEASDFGQLVRELRIGTEGGPFLLQAGPMALYTLGRAHVVSRYANVTNPNYHPLGAASSVQLGALRVEAMASDVLAARLFSGEVTLDLGRLATDDASHHDRYHASLSYAHDFGHAGLVTPQVGIAQLDLDAALYKSDRAQVFAYTGVGTRLFAGRPDVGFLVGISADGQTDGPRLGGRLEGRRQGGAFRQGFFGPTYELSRFSGTGLQRDPIADERLPFGYSAFAEGSISTGADARLFPEKPQLQLSASGEYFGFGRLDADVAVTGRMGNSVARLRAALVGFPDAPRFSISAEGRYRFAPSLYALASGGNVFFPQETGGLVRGWFASIGVGADLER